MILQQTYGLFFDAYRELNAKKLFWLTMGLNLFAVVIFASWGINEKGVTVLHWTLDYQFMNTHFISKELFYKLQFTTLGVPVWLSWATTILALISTAGIIPDMVSGGTIEPMLSKPISRVRLFLTKYLTGLLFVALQVFVFSLGCFLVLGIRAGAWELGLFLAVPIVLAFFSFLFSFCVLVGLVTRSTIAALLLTILFWGMIFLANVGDSIVLAQREGSILRAQDRQTQVEAQERFAAKRIELYHEEGKPVPGEAEEPLPEGVPDSLSAVNPTLMSARNRLQEAQEAAQTWKGWTRRIVLLKTVLPKTQETIHLLDRNLISDEELANFNRDGNTGPGEQNEDVPAMADPRVAERVQSIMRNRTIWWILGTSFIFEGLMLTISTIIFVRRDF